MKLYMGSAVSSIGTYIFVFNEQLVLDISLNKIYNTYRDLHTRIILNNVLKLLLIMQSIVENVFCHNNFIECCYLM